VASGRGAAFRPLLAAVEPSGDLLCCLKIGIGARGIALALIGQTPVVDGFAVAGIEADCNVIVRDTRETKSQAPAAMRQPTPSSEDDSSAIAQ